MNNRIKKLVLTAMFLAIGFVLPMLTGQIPVIGKILLPMHIPVFLCGLICGSLYGGVVGFALPLLRSLIFSVPVMYPTAIAVAFEMAIYGILVGILYGCFKKKSLATLYFSLICTMVAGRIVRCVAEIILLNLKGNPFVWKAFFAGTIFNAVPGIIIQLIIIPAVMVAVGRTERLKLHKKGLSHLGQNKKG